MPEVPFHRRLNSQDGEDRGVRVVVADGADGVKPFFLLVLEPGSWELKVTRVGHAISSDGAQFWES